MTTTVRAPNPAPSPLFSSTPAEAHTPVALAPVASPSASGGKGSVGTPRSSA
jgi:hypothetical protein